MNITADPGLLYNMSELFTINITKKRIYFTADSLPPGPSHRDQKLYKNL